MLRVHNDGYKVQRHGGRRKQAGEELLEGSLHDQDDQQQLPSAHNALLAGSARKSCAMQLHKASYNLLLSGIIKQQPGKKNPSKLHQLISLLARLHDQVAGLNLSGPFWAPVHEITS
ncbi:hypothetical protein Baya_6503 [Bagarius yarrelli]|uniref:Uncharacterized protein n=1 Tax=Bagarius yarrelli TaxID=175774 RepID=A0A556U0E9_BAGYA|nr:hypothetical protein Baya_6503 [Bagarius yarrelli]